jgi:hypothetical protein
MDEGDLTALCELCELEPNETGSAELSRLRGLIEKKPSLINEVVGNGRLLDSAVYANNFETVGLLLDLGADIDLPDSDRDISNTPIRTAISRGHIELVKYLISRGAKLDEEGERLILSAVLSRHDDDTALELVKLLQTNGLDINRSYFHGTRHINVNAFRVAVENGHDKTAEYLKSQGCAMPSQDDLPPGFKKPTAVLIEHFEKHFGAVDERSFSQIIPSPFGAAIDIRIVPAAENHDHVVLFTEGLSEFMMFSPSGDENRIVELYIELPADWLWQEKDDPNWNWPVTWLQSIAATLSEDNVWMETFTIFANESLAPIGPNLKFTNFLLMNDQDVSRKEKLPLNLYRLVPLTTAERQLEMDKGLPKLLTSLDEAAVSMTVERERKCIVTGE